MKLKTHKNPASLTLNQDLNWSICVHMCVNMNGVKAEQGEIYRRERRGENKRVDEGKKGNKGDDLVIKGIMIHVCENTIIKLIILYATSKS